MRSHYFHHNIKMVLPFLFVILRLKKQTAKQWMDKIVGVRPNQVTILKCIGLKSKANLLQKGSLPVSL